MLAVAATIAASIALIVALLAVPVVLFIDAERVDRLESRWRLIWLFGLVDLRSSGSQPASVRKRADATKRAHKPKKKRGTGWRKGLALLRTRGLLERVMRLARALLRQVRLERFYVDTEFGFENPADTGFFFGWLSPVLVMANLRGLDVHCSPMFLESGVRGVFRATIRVRPLSVSGAIVSFLLSPPVFRAVSAAWRARK